MVDSRLLEQVLQLDVASRRELIRAVEDSLHDDVPADVRAEVERRLAAMGPRPSSDYITLDDFRSEISGRRAQRAG